MELHTQYKTIGDIKGTNWMRIKTGTESAIAAEELLLSHASEAPVVDPNGRYLGFIGEKDLLKALMAGRDLWKVQVEDLMTQTVPVVMESTSIMPAALLMAERNLMHLPVVRDGVLIMTISRHDLLRALLDSGLGIKE